VYYPSNLGVKVPMIMGIYLACVERGKRHRRIGRVGEEGGGRMIVETLLIVIAMTMTMIMRRRMRTRTMKNVVDDEDEVALFLHENGVGPVMQDGVRCAVGRPKMTRTRRMDHPVNAMLIR
jgi:hypothetical protein